jgi:DNA-directed RNA polymerase specialized sigma24 family protein
MKRDWKLTREAFDNLLSWLSPDREEAGQKYEEIRLKLIRLFNCRGCGSPEELADETINRVIKIVQEGTIEYSGNPILLFFGVARNVGYEWVRQKTLRPENFFPAPSGISEQELACLERCMKRLPETSREVIVRYYEEQGRGKIQNRQEIAAQLGIAVNALRIQACRIRKLLRGCVFTCIQAGSQ